MSAIVILVIRIATVIVLYCFLATALFFIWKRSKTNLPMPSKGETSQPIFNLIIYHNEHVSRFTLESNQISIGRDSTNDLQLLSNTVSSRHAMLRYSNNHWWLEDLKSKNGTYLNGTRVSTPVVITNSDKIRLGEIVILINRQHVGTEFEEKE